MSFINHSVSIVYNDIRTMLKESKLKVGMTVEVLGYHDIDDSPSGCFFITDDDTLVEDKGRVFALTNGLFAVRVIDTNTSEIPVSIYGAYGDGVHDDTEAIENCINNNDSVLFGDNKYYLISRPINILRDGVTIDFNGSVIKVKDFKENGAFNIDQTKLEASDGETTRKIVIKNGTIEVPDLDEVFTYLEKKNRYGIYINTPVDNVEIIDVNIYTYGIKDSGIYVSDFHDTSNPDTVEIDIRGCNIESKTGLHGDMSGIEIVNHKVSVMNTTVFAYDYGINCISKEDVSTNTLTVKDSSFIASRGDSNVLGACGVLSRNHIVESTGNKYVNYTTGLSLSKEGCTVDNSSFTLTVDNVNNNELSAISFLYDTNRIDFKNNTIINYPRAVYLTTHTVPNMDIDNIIYYAYQDYKLDSSYLLFFENTKEYPDSRTIYIHDSKYTGISGNDNKISNIGNSLSILGNNNVFKNLVDSPISMSTYEILNLLSSDEDDVTYRYNETDVKSSCIGSVILNPYNYIKNLYNPDKTVTSSKCTDSGAVTSIDVVKEDGTYSLTNNYGTYNSDRQSIGYKATVNGKSGAGFDTTFDMVYNYDISTRKPEPGDSFYTAFTVLNRTSSTLGVDINLNFNCSNGTTAIDPVSINIYSGVVENTSNHNTGQRFESVINLERNSFEKIYELKNKYSDFDYTFKSITIHISESNDNTNTTNDITLYNIFIARMNPRDMAQYMFETSSSISRSYKDYVEGFCDASSSYPFEEYRVSVKSENIENKTLKLMSIPWIDNYAPYYNIGIKSLIPNGKNQLNYTDDTSVYSGDFLQYVDIVPEPCGFRAIYKHSLETIPEKEIYLPLISINDYTFRRNTTFYFNANIKMHSNSKELDGALRVYIDNQLTATYLMDDTDKKNISVEPGKHTVQVVVVFSDNDVSPLLQLDLTNFFFTEFNNEEIYSMDIHYNTYYRVPLYRNGIVALTPSDFNNSFNHNTPDPFDNEDFSYLTSRGQLNVIYPAPEEDVEKYIENTIYPTAITVETGYTQSKNKTGEASKFTILGVGELDAVITNFTPINTTETNLSYESSDPSVCTVKNGIITGIKSGTATITVTTENGLSASIGVEVQVFAKNMKIKDKTSYQGSVMHRGMTGQFDVEITPNNLTEPYKIKWETSNPKIVRIGEYTGNYSVRNAGSSVIAASLIVTRYNIMTGKEEDITIASDNMLITADVPTEGVAIYDETGHVPSTYYPVGSKLKLVATFIPEDTSESKHVTWEVSDTSVISIETSADTLTSTITVNKVGTSSISISNGKFSDLIEIEGIIPISSISLDRSSIEINRDETYSFKVIKSPSDTTDKTEVSKWTSSDPLVATVDDNGVVTGVGKNRDLTEQTCTITAELNTLVLSGSDAPKKITFTATATVKVDVPLQGISLSKSTLFFNNKKDYSVLSVIYNPPDTTSDITVTWLSTDVSVATVSNNGIVTAINTGECNIIATVGNYTATCAVTVDVLDSHYNHVFDSEVKATAKQVISYGYDCNILFTADALYEDSNNSDDSEDNDTKDPDPLFNGANNSASIVNAANVLELSKKIELAMILQGGNICTDYTTLPNFISKIQEMTTIYNKSKIVPNYILGDRDFNDGYLLYDKTHATVDDVMTPEMRNTYCNNAEDTSNIGYYYKDFTRYHVRAICLNSHDTYEVTDGKLVYNRHNKFGFSKAQVNWFVDTLKSVPEDYSVIVFSHMGIIKETAPLGMDAPMNGEIINDILCAYQSGGYISDTTHYNDEQFDWSDAISFSKNHGKVIGVVSSMGGFDMYVKYRNDNYANTWDEKYINHIVTGPSLPYNPTQDKIDALNTRLADMANANEKAKAEQPADSVVSTIPYYSFNAQFRTDRATGTIRQDIIDIITIDMKADRFAIVRFGAGTDRPDENQYYEFV